MPNKHPLPYFSDSADIFAHVAHKPWAVWLDSAYPYSQQGRYDILAADPVITLETKAYQTTVVDHGAMTVSDDDPFYLLQKYLGPKQTSSSGLPFNGGAIGYFSYDLGRRIEKLPVLAVDSEAISDMAIGIYHWAVVVDHQLKESWLVHQDIHTSVISDLLKLFSVAANRELLPFTVLAEPELNFTKQQYAQAFDRIKDYMLEGDCYQVNLTQRFVSPCQGDPWTAYCQLRKLNAAPFSAYLNIPDVQILSSSPERFLQVKDQWVETKPIKGTRRRHAESDADQAQIKDLQTSPKDRAENVMIVDLLRNDIGKSCEPGTVRVPEIFAIETYATVHHLVSTVIGQLSPNKTAIDILRSCFPGGSITGAPKIRSMEIIEELEPNRRGIYCGSVAYIGFNGNMDSNIAIRTLVHNQGEIRFWAGGGIVRDSVMEDEYQECFDKAAALLRLLQGFMR